MTSPIQAKRFGRIGAIGLLVLVSWTLNACQEELPTSQEGGFLPVAATTVDLRLDFEDFALDPRVLGGYGTAAELGSAFLARSFRGSLDARTLGRFAPYPVSLSVRDTTGAVRPDSSLTFIGGKVVAVFDTLASVHDGPVTVAGNAIQQEWHGSTASWEFAVDTVGDHRRWEEEGAGPAVPFDTAIWDPAESDSVILEVDSATVAEWGDTTNLGRGLRLDAVTEGVRLHVNTVRLFLVTRPSSNPDTLVDALTQLDQGTFVYRPVLEAPESDLRVGGTPAWRTVFRMALPEALDGPEDLCAEVVCPLVLEPEMVNAASLILHTAETPEAFQPTDTLRIDVRPVLEPSLLPKSPLGSSLTGFQGIKVPPSYFAEDAGSELIVPLNTYVKDLIRGETAAGNPVPETVTLLSSFEPFSLQFATFLGTGSAQPPELRLVLTLGEGVQLR